MPTIDYPATAMHSSTQFNTLINNDIQQPKRVQRYKTIQPSPKQTFPFGELQWTQTPSAPKKSPRPLYWGDDPSQTDDAGNIIDAKEKKARYRKKRLIYAIIFCSVLFVLEFAGGLLTGSLAILADSFHMLSDVIGYVISFVALYFATIPQNQFYTYGYKRLEVVGAMLSILCVWVLSVGLIIEAISRFSNPQPININMMLMVSIAGVAVNLILLFIFGHEEKDDVKSPVQISSKEGSDNVDPESMTNLANYQHMDDLNLRAAMLHAIGDLVCSVGVVIAAVILFFYPTWLWVDPTTTIIFGIVALSTTFGIIRDIYKVIMQSTPSHIDIVKLEFDLIELDKNIVDCLCKVWSLTDGEFVSDIKVVVLPSISFIESQDIVNSIRQAMENTYLVSSNTIEVSHSLKQ
jgi:cation diffusion facilitator family transporter